jgi:alpha-tubulin suppressor-like RCC1 family protein
MHIMTLFSASRLITFLRSNLAALIVGLMVVALPVAIQAPQRADAAPMTGFSRVATGDSFTCGVKTDGTVWCWGRNNLKQLGDGTTTNRTRPVQVTGLTGATQVIAGQGWACVLKSDGTVACWGDNSSGQLGDGTTTGRSAPAVIPDLTGVTQISGNFQHVCVRLSDSTARCWGWNVLYQLGDGTTTSRLSPVAPSNLTGVAQISAGVFQTCARLNDGTVRCWGAGNHGGLGDGNGTYSTSTKTIPTGLSDVAQIASGTGWNNACALLTTGVLKCWGLNDNGQLGDGSTTSRWTPVISGSFPAAISAVDLGMYISCAVLVDTTATCWGWNGMGALGDGTTVSRWVPTLVSGLTGVNQISPNYYHTCAVLSDTTVKCWGRNTYGELGNGTTTNSSTAVSVSAPPVTLTTPSSVAASATASTLKSINVSWAANVNASSFTVKIYNSAGSSLLGTKTGVTGSSTTITSSTYGSIADNTAYKISVTAIGDGTNYLSSSESTQDSVTTNTLSSQAAVVLTSTSGTYGTDITLATSGGSGSGAVTYAVTTTGTAGCSITGGTTLKATSIGTCTVTATKAANGLYLSDSSNATTVTFSAAVVTTTTTTTAAPALSIVIQAPVTTVAQGQASVVTLAPTTTTVPALGANGLPVPTTTSTTIAAAKSKTVVTTTTVAPRVTTTTVGPPSAGKVEAGQTAVQVDGVETDAKVSRANNQMIVDAGSLTATLSGLDTTGKTLALDSDGNVHLSAGDVIKVSVGGFKPDSIVEVWLFSTPTQLGSAVVGADGAMNGTYKLPFGIKSGSHRVVVTAKLLNGKATTFTFGILVGNISKTSTLTRVLIAIPISLAIGFGFLLPNQARRRKRRAAI